jgi:hypothetical protein
MATIEKTVAASWREIISKRVGDSAEMAQVYCRDLLKMADEVTWEALISSDNPQAAHAVVNHIRSKMGLKRIEAHPRKEVDHVPITPPTP